MDIELIDLLFESDVKWNDYIAKKDDDVVIDFSFQVLKEKGLGNRVFRNCDFTGGQFEFVNFDGSKFDKCKFDHASILYTSFVGCEFFDCIFLNDKIEHTTFRNTKILQCTFEKEQMWKTDILSCEIGNGLFTDVTFKEIEVSDSIVYIIQVKKSVVRDININRCRFQDVNITRYAFLFYQISKTVFDDCSFCEGIIRFGNTNKVVFCKSVFRDLRVKEHNLKECEIVQSQMRELDLKEWRLSETIYVGTHFDSCTWPDMRYRLSMCGTLKTPIHLPVTPIQDMSGINPMLRRTIRDSQYLDYIHKKCNNFVKKFLFCCWGATSGYGQSVSRLLATLLGGTVIIAIAGIIRDKVIQKTIDWSKIFQYVFSVFLKVINADLVYNIALDPWVVFMAQLFGLIWFGLLIGVVAAKLTQLGTD